MNGLFLVLTIGGHRVALPSDTVESVVEIDDIAPVPLVQPHIAGLFALRSRVMTVVDSLASLAAGKTERKGLSQAVIVNCDGHGYALLVESVEDVVKVDGGVSPSRAALEPNWARITIGEIVTGGETLLVLDPAGLVAGPIALAA